MSEKHIFGKLAESEKYLGINPLFEKAFALRKARGEREVSWDQSAF